MGGYGDVQLLRDDGLRLDGRKIDEMRPVKIEAGVLPAADGSAMVTHGLNVAVAAVYGPMEAHPRKIQRQDRAVIDVRYNMAPFSTSDRIRPGYNRRSREISKVTALPKQLVKYMVLVHPQFHNYSQHIVKTSKTQLSI